MKNTMCLERLDSGLVVHLLCCEHKSDGFVMWWSPTGLNSESDRQTAGVQDHSTALCDVTRVYSEQSEL